MLEQTLARGAEMCRKGCPTWPPCLTRVTPLRECGSVRPMHGHAWDRRTYYYYEDTIKPSLVLCWTTLDSNFRSMLYKSRASTHFHARHCHGTWHVRSYVTRGGSFSCGMPACPVDVVKIRGIESTSYTCVIFDSISINECTYTFWLEQIWASIVLHGWLGKGNDHHELFFRVNMWTHVQPRSATLDIKVELQPSQSWSFHPSIAPPTVTSPASTTAARLRQPWALNLDQFGFFELNLDQLGSNSIWINSNPWAQYE